MSDQKRVLRLQRAGRAAGMTHISEALDRVMGEITLRACAAGHPPPSFQTGGYDDPDDAPKDPTDPPTTPTR